MKLLLEYRMPITKLEYFTNNCITRVCVKTLKNICKYISDYI